MSDEFGEVFTKRWVVDLMLDMVDYTPAQDLTRLTVVEPSIGSGAFIVPLVERLLASRRDSADWAELKNCIRAFDIQPQHVAACRQLVADQLTAAGCPADSCAELLDAWFHVGDFLLSTKADLFSAGLGLSADLVIGNPPYIRIEDLAPATLAAYRRVAPTMKGRADIFVGFFEHGLDLLAPGGKLAFICADRWARNGYGKALREKITDGNFAVDAFLTMHDASAFETEVSAYPAITVLRRGAQGQAVTATATESFDHAAATQFSEWAPSTEPTLRTPDVRAARMDTWHASADWPDADPETLAWLADVAAACHPIETTDKATRIGIGIATGSDAIYLPREQPDVEPSQLVPMIMPDDIRGESFNWGGRHLVSPWGPNGPVDLKDFPRLCRYFTAHSDALQKRSIAQRSAAWYRTIDRLNLDLLKGDIIVMQDMKATAHPVRVPAGHYPHHNLTWFQSTEWDLDVLGGLLLSELTQRQVAAHCVKMRGGTLRFQPTVMRKVRLPRPDMINDRDAQRLAQAFRHRDRVAATSAAFSAAGVPAPPE